MTVQDFKNRVASRINQVTTAGILAPGFIQSGEIIRWLNDGLWELVEKVSKHSRDHFEQEAVADLIADQHEYEIYSTAMADRMAVTDVLVKYSTTGEYKIAAMVPHREILNEKAAGSSVSPIFAQFTKDVSGDNLLHIYLDPAPTANVTDGLKIFYTEYYPELSTNENTFELPTRKMYEWLERYVALQAFDKMENETMIARTEQKLKLVEREMLSSFIPRSRAGYAKVVPTSQSSYYYAKSRGWV